MLNSHSRFKNLPGLFPLFVIFVKPKFCDMWVQSTGQLNPPKTKINKQTAQLRQKLNYKSNQPAKKTSSNKSIDSRIIKVIRQTEKKDSNQTVIKDNKNVEQTKVQYSSPAVPDSMWNIYTGNPGLYNTEGDTTGFGNVAYLPDSVFLENSRNIIEKTAKPYGIEGKPIITVRDDWSLVFILLAWILFASVKIGFGKYMDLLMGSILKVNTAIRLYSERGYKTMYGAVRLNLLFYLILPLAAFQILDFFGGRIPGFSGIYLFLVLFMCINGFILLKSTVYRAIGSVIMLQEEVNESVFNIFLFYKVLAIFLLPVVTIHAIENRTSQVTVWLMMVLIVLFYFVSILRSIYIGSRKGISNFYLILYLCLLEILPLVLIYKLITMG